MLDHQPVDRNCDSENLPPENCESNLSAVNILAGEVVLKRAAVQHRERGRRRLVCSEKTWNLSSPASPEDCDENRWQGLLDHCKKTIQTLSPRWTLVQNRGRVPRIEIKIGKKWKRFERKPKMKRCAERVTTTRWGYLPVHIPK